MSRVENALQAIYEDPGLRDELQDAEAEKLLQWAETELTRLDTTGADDAAFDEKVSELRRLLKGMNRLVGRRDQIGAQASDDALDKLAAHANALGYALTPDQLAAFAAEGAALDGISAVERLTALVSQTETPAHSHTEPPIAAQVADTPAEAPAEVELQPVEAQTAQPSPETVQAAFVEQPPAASVEVDPQPSLADAHFWDAGMTFTHMPLIEADTEDSLNDPIE